MRRSLAVGVVASVLGVHAGAQGMAVSPARPAGMSGVVAAQAMAPTPKKFGASQNTDVLRHRDPAGKPCLAIDGSVRAFISNPNLFDHLITATNSCIKPIKMQVCYYRTQQCVAMDVPGRSRKQAILGTLPSVKDFKFEFRERF